jgi:hypothetical protein
MTSLFSPVTFFLLNSFLIPVFSSLSPIIEVFLKATC